MSADSPRRGASARCGGHSIPCVVPPQIVSDRSILDSAIGFINDVTLAAHQPHNDPKNTITWARFESMADISDPRHGEDWELEGNVAPPLLLVLGYGLGVQVWAIPANGEAVEALSWRHGSVSALRVLPTPLATCHEDAERRADELADLYAEKRPLIALCDGGGTKLAGAAQPQFCAVNFVSLKTGAQVKTIKFKNPVLDILANRTSIAITFHERIAVFDARTLEDRLSITSCYPSPGVNPNPVALGSRWLAYAEHKLLHSKRSGGGCDGEAVASYTATVLNAAKSFGKGLRELGEQVAAGLTGAGSGGSSGSNSKSNSFDSNSSGDMRQPGIITVMDIKHPVKDFSPTSGTPVSSSGSDPFVAHFIAHSEAIVALEFDNSGMLLVTADKRGHDFHVFRIQPHPVGSSLAAVHHLYVLHRGDTSAKVQHIAYSLDSRWVAVSTLRGTTHVFPITPYGGPMGVRTHTSLHVVNKLSRFHRSAGLSVEGRSSSPISHSESTTFSQSLMPYHNPTLPPYSRPTVVLPLAQLRQPFALGSPPGSAASAASSSKSPASASTGGSGCSQRQRLSSLSDDNGKPLSVCAIFAKSRSWLLDPPNATWEAPHRMQRKAMDSLFVMAGHGALIQYDLDTRLALNVAKEKICDETPIELEVEAKAQWNLGRRDGAQEIVPPLSADNWLIKDRNSCMLTDSSRQFDDADDRADSWLSQVEIITHAGPHRRLWMGPQFLFKTYNTPSGSNLSHIEAESIEIGVAAATSAAAARAERSSPLNMPLSATGRASVPILIESGSYSSIEQSPKLMDRFHHEHLNSDYAVAHGDTRLKEDLADAMRESPSVPKPNAAAMERLLTDFGRSDEMRPVGVSFAEHVGVDDDATKTRLSSAAALARAVPNIYSYATHFNGEETATRTASIEKVVNPLGTVTTIIAGMSTEASTDILDEVVSQLAAEEAVIHENCDESLFRPVVAIFCDEKGGVGVRGEEAELRQELCKPPEVIANKLIVPVIEKELDEELSKKERLKLGLTARGRRSRKGSANAVECQNYGKTKESERLSTEDGRRDVAELEQLSKKREVESDSKQQEDIALAEKFPEERKQSVSIMLKENAKETTPNRMELLSTKSHEKCSAEKSAKKTKNDLENVAEKKTKTNKEVGTKKPRDRKSESNKTKEIMTNEPQRINKNQEDKSNNAFNDDENARTAREKEEKKTVESNKSIHKEEIAGKGLKRSQQQHNQDENHVTKSEESKEAKSTMLDLKKQMPEKNAEKKTKKTETKQPDEKELVASSCEDASNIEEEEKEETTKPKTTKNRQRLNQDDQREDAVTGNQQSIEECSGKVSAECREGSATKESSVKTKKSGGDDDDGKDELDSVHTNQYTKSSRQKEGQIGRGRRQHIEENEKPFNADERKSRAKVQKENSLESLRATNFPQETEKNTVAENVKAAADKRTLSDTATVSDSGTNKKIVEKSIKIAAEEIEATGKIREDSADSVGKISSNDITELNGKVDKVDTPDKIRSLEKANKCEEGLRQFQRNKTKSVQAKLKFSAAAELKVPSEVMVLEAKTGKNEKQKPSQSTSNSESEEIIEATVNIKPKKGQRRTPANTPVEKSKAREIKTTASSEEETSAELGDNKRNIGPEMLIGFSEVKEKDVAVVMAVDAAALPANDTKDSEQTTPVNDSNTEESVNTLKASLKEINNETEDSNQASKTQFKDLLKKTEKTSAERDHDQVCIHKAKAQNNLTTNESKLKKLNENNSAKNQKQKSRLVREDVAISSSLSLSCQMQERIAGTTKSSITITESDVVNKESEAEASLKSPKNSSESDNVDSGKDSSESGLSQTKAKGYLIKRSDKKTTQQKKVKTATKHSEQGTEAMETDNFEIQAQTNAKTEKEVLSDRTSADNSKQQAEITNVDTKIIPQAVSLADTNITKKSKTETQLEQLKGEDSESLGEDFKIQQKSKSLLRDKIDSETTTTTPDDSKKKKKDNKLSSVEKLTTANSSNEQKTKEEALIFFEKFSPEHKKSMVQTNSLMSFVKPVSVWQALSGADMINQQLVKSERVKSREGEYSSSARLKDSEDKLKLDSIKSVEKYSSTPYHTPLNAVADDFPVLNPSAPLPPLPRALLEPLNLSDAADASTSCNSKDADISNAADASPVSLINFESPQKGGSPTTTLRRSEIIPPPRGFTEQNLILALCGSLHYENESDHSRSTPAGTGRKSTVDYKSLIENINDEQYLSLEQSSQDTPTSQENVTSSTSNNSSEFEEVNVAAAVVSKKAKKQQQQRPKRQRDRSIKNSKSVDDADDDDGDEDCRNNSDAGNESAGNVDDEELQPLLSLSESQIEPARRSTIAKPRTAETYGTSGGRSGGGGGVTTDSEGPMAATTTSDDNNYHAYTTGRTATAATTAGTKIKTKKLEHKINLIAAIEAATSSSSSTSSAEESGVEGGGVGGGGCVGGSDGCSSAAIAVSTDSAVVTLATSNIATATMSNIQYPPTVSQQSASKKKTKRRRR